MNSISKSTLYAWSVPHPTSDRRNGQCRALPVSITCCNVEDVAQPSTQKYHKITLKTYGCLSNPDNSAKAPECGGRNSNPESAFCSLNRRRRPHAAERWHKCDQMRKVWDEASNSVSGASWNQQSPKDIFAPPTGHTAP